MQKWTVEIRIDDSWIADGLVITEDNLKNCILESLAGYANQDEVQVKIIDSPPVEKIRELQEMA